MKVAQISSTKKLCNECTFVNVKVHLHYQNLLPHSNVNHNSHVMRNYFLSSREIDSSVSTGHFCCCCCLYFLWQGRWKRLKSGCALRVGAGFAFHHCQNQCKYLMTSIGCRNMNKGIKCFRRNFQFFLRTIFPQHFVSSREH